MNPVLKTVLDQALNRLKKEFVKAVLAKAITAFPAKLASFLNPILGFFIGRVWEWGEEYLMEFLKNFATLINNIIIDLERSAKNEAYKEASLELKKILAEYGIDHEKTKQISDDYDKRLGDLIIIPPRLRPHKNS